MISELLLKYLTKKGELPRVKVIAVDQGNKEDVKNARLVQGMIAEDFSDKYGEIIRVITVARMYIFKAYGVQTPNKIWNRIVEEVVRMDMNNIIRIGGKK